MVALMACLLAVGFTGTTLLLAQDKEPDKASPPRVGRPGPADNAAGAIGDGPAVERTVKVVALRHQPAEAAARTLRELQPLRPRDEARAATPVLTIAVNEPANAIVLAGPPPLVERMVDVLAQLDEMTAARIQIEKERRQDQAADRGRDLPQPEWRNRQRGEMPGAVGPLQGRGPDRMGRGRQPQNPMMERQGPRGPMAPQGLDGDRQFRYRDAQPQMRQRGDTPPLDRPDQRGPLDERGRAFPQRGFGNQFPGERGMRREPIEDREAPPEGVPQ
jgi:hypothetical protein